MNPRTRAEPAKIPVDLEAFKRVVELTRQMYRQGSGIRVVFSALTGGEGFEAPTSPGSRHDLTDALEVLIDQQQSDFNDLDVVLEQVCEANDLNYGDLTGRGLPAQRGLTKPS